MVAVLLEVDEIFVEQLVNFVILLIDCFGGGFQFFFQLHILLSQHLVVLHDSLRFDLRSVQVELQGARVLALLACLGLRVAQCFSRALEHLSHETHIKLGAEQLLAAALLLIRQLFVLFTQYFQFVDHFVIFLLQNVKVLLHCL